MTETSMIAFDQLGIGGVLKQYQLIMPPNQREYAWTEKEVKTLFQDFAKAIADEEQGYFLGTIVTIPKDGGYVEVVDGQQRLATTAMLLTAMRDYLKGREDIIVESINNEFLTGVDRVRRERIPRLKLNIDDNEFFKGIINNQKPNPTRFSHELIKEAFDQARQQVQKIVAPHNEKDHGDILNKWIQFIEKGALVILLRVSSEANAYKMFETLNDRGLKTSQSDLVKNYLFGRSGDRIEEVKQKWAYMRGTLQSFAEEEDLTVRFLRHAMIAMKGWIKESAVYETIQSIAKSPQSTATFMADIELMSSTYAAIHLRENEKWNGYPDTTRKAIDVLNMIDLKPIRPLMLAIAHKFSEKETDKAFKYLVSSSVRLLIASSPTSGSIETPISAIANKVFLGEITTVDNIRKSLQEVVPNNELFRLRFEIATISNEKFARYFLRSLEMTAKDEKEPWLIVNDDAQAINLEHVLPKKPQGNWPQFNDDSVRLYSKRIGNLVLLKVSSNSDLKSGPFAEKKKVFSTSPFVLTKQVADAENWLPETISDRQKNLAVLALKTWAL